MSDSISEHKLDENDHRVIGKQMDLFHIQPEAVGQIFWHPKGWKLYTLIQDYIRSVQEKYGYREVRTPQLVDRKLWESSGHWDKYRENMFCVQVEDENSTLALKPMNCPCHIEIFNNSLKSYRELPIRMAEFGACHRYEPSGSLHGLMRVRGFNQDDAHIFCKEDQISDEIVAFIKMADDVYQKFGFDGFKVKFSDRPEKRAGTDEQWDKAEQALKDACKIAGIEYELNSGDGAFYGPKLEFVLTDIMGREWQCGTIQTDFILPKRLNALYIGDDSKRHIPVILHRAILGSFERFIGILIEHYAGRFPVWLSPVQVVVANISEGAADYAQKVYEYCKESGIRVELDIRNEKINRKIKDSTDNHVPVMFIVGEREKENGTVSIRKLGVKGQETIRIDGAVQDILY